MKRRKAHFIGISGKGMSAVAKLLQDQGWEISGSDAEFYPPVSDYLRRHNLPLTEGYRSKNIPNDVDIIVIGKNAKLVPESNEEVRAAFAKGVPVRSFPEVLQGLVEGTENIVVAGSYGKSTVSALIGWCLVCAGKDPSYFIGEIVRGMNDHARLGNGNLFVLEGDEYPSANWDTASKFLYYKPTDLILTAAVHDHVNVFPTQRAFELPFKNLISLLPADGLLVVCGDEANARRIAQESFRPVVLYGLDSDDLDWSASGIRYAETTTFSLTRKADPVVDLSISLLGRHNVQNVVGAAAFLLERELLDLDALQAAMASFAGVKRRMELLTRNTSVPVYEGFGSSYDKARSALDAVCLHFPNRRIVTVFEPHTFSWRSREMVHWYDDVFNGSAMVLIYHPAAQGADTHKQLSQDEIVRRVQSAGVDARAIGTAQQMLATLGDELLPTDVVLILTSGGFDGMIEKITRLVEYRFGNHERLADDADAVHAANFQGSRAAGGKR
jgi:UDP-N-acetylmuramate: L-alanyl-gamma-D-glutamyl-meso-diaminopimelate ligase